MSDESPGQRVRPDRPEPSRAAARGGGSPADGAPARRDKPARGAAPRGGTPSRGGGASRDGTPSAGATASGATASGAAGASGSTSSRGRAASSGGASSRGGAASSGSAKGGGSSGGSSTPQIAGGLAGGMVRPLYVTGLVGALWCVGIGLAVLTTITLIGWIAAPRNALGAGLPGVFRTAVNFWLVSHHAGFSAGHGRVGLLPLGLLVLPGALLYRSGGWMVRAVGIAGTARRYRVGVVHVAVALAVPYALLAGMLALAAASSAVQASVWQALVACFMMAVLAGGLGAARAVVAQGEPGARVRSGLGALLNLLPDRPRSLVIGVTGSIAVLLASGALVVGGSLAMHMAEADRLYDMLAPGIIGGVLLFLIQLAYLPNAVIWGMAYTIGPGFSVGASTTVSPTGVFLDIVPTFPVLAALPEPGPAPAISLFALAAPFVAGAVGGVLTVRNMPSPVYEAAPLWGFVSGALTGAVAALLAALSGGPLGSGRMATMGPSAWQVGLLAALEVGISAAIAAWIANWLILRRPAGNAAKATRTKRRWRRPAPSTATAPATASTAARAATPPAAPEPPAPPVPRKPAPYAPDPLEFEEAEPILAPRKPSRPRARYGEPLPDLMEDADDLAAPEPEPRPEPAPRARPTPARDGGGAASADARDGREGASAPAPEPRRVASEELHVEPEPAEERRPVPPPRHRDDPERTENRGGAIYVLRDEPGQD
ncbi:DUF6350 family protein [Spirillospora sp. NPDC047279]|uniref:cell division protein PerM n=1 Tax=Spirillospora sp. NPDC047279 TaxID=3155478 RepID=UPI0033CBEF28